MLLQDATLADGRRRDVRIDRESGTVAAVESQLSPGDDPVVDARGKRLLPGAVDVHVHFREPGASHKETWTTGSRAAAAGGVTTVVDQPNTDPPTVDGAAFDDKAAHAAANSLVDFGINGGVVPDWDPDALLARPLFALGEVFLADSTGEMGIDRDRFADAVGRAADDGVPVTVHAEDESLFDEAARERPDADAWSAYRTAEAEVAAVETACEVGGGASNEGATTASAHDGDSDLAGNGAPEPTLHIAHTSTPGGVDAAAACGATCEVTPHHLLLSREDLPELGTLGRMNPPLRSEDRRRQLYERVADGRVDMIATDHAPHTRAEKDASIWDAPSGVPGVETMLPLLLAEAGAGRLSYERVRDLTAANPASAFDLPRKGRVEAGRDADLVLVDPDDAVELRAADLHSKCGWTPFEGWTGVRPAWTAVRGEVVYAAPDSDLPDAVAPDGTFGAAVGRNVRGGR